MMKVSLPPKYDIHGNVLAKQTLNLGGQKKVPSPIGSNDFKTKTLASLLSNKTEQMDYQNEAQLVLSFLLILAYTLE